jgi:hypothetical protein
MEFFMITKKFSKSYDDALTQAYLFQSELVADQALFTAFSSKYAPTFAADFLADIQAADDIPTNEDDLNSQTLLSRQVEDKMELCKVHYQKLLLHVGFAWPNDDLILKVFGNNDYMDARRNPSKLTNLLQNAYNRANSTTYKADLISAGFIQADITLLDTLNDDLRAKLDEQQSFINHSTIRAQERAVAFNKVWDTMVQISNASKLIFKDNPAKVEYYLLYPEGPGPGSLSAPTGLRYFFTNKALYWDELPNATSYVLYYSETDDENDYTEIYSGSATEFAFIPNVQGWNYFSIKGRNSNGLGPAAFLKQGYYDGTVLPTPQNITIQLVSGTTNSVKLTWDEVPSAERYKIYKSIVAVGDPVGANSNIGQVDANEFIETVDSGHRYYYHVTAENGNQWSPVTSDVFIDVN